MSAVTVQPTVLDTQEAINFQTANILLLEQGAHGLDILIQIFASFGTRNCYKSMCIEEAQGVAARATLDLVLVDPSLKNEDGYEFVRWLRRSGPDHNRVAPVIALSANGTKSAVSRARDAGASFFVVKPVRPAVLLDRIVRIVRDARNFVVSDSYVGPDRRFKHEGLPAGVGPRRSTDFTGALGEAATPNMSQGEIDMLIKPQTVKL
jgi:DNA-binding response OmpR family regulator